MPHRTDIPLFVPGRLCLFGEHSDWAAEFGLHRGYCLVVGTDQGLRAQARACEDFAIETALRSQAGQPAPIRRVRLPWQEKALLEAAGDQDEFFRYAAGVAYQLLTRRPVKGGIDLRIGSMDLPLRKGVASSAAICILVAKAFDAVYQLNLLPQEIMDLAYMGEKLTGSKCGRMDQACIFGRTPVLLTFSRDSRVDIQPVYPPGEIPLFFVDLAGQKDTVRILADLGQAYPQSRRLQRALGPLNQQVVREAYHMLEDGDAVALGTLMTKAQRAFDRLISPHSTQLASPVLHELLAWGPLQEHVWGGKGVGSQGDGTAQFVARSPAARDAAMGMIHQHFPGMQCFPLTILPQSG